jgi:hypothetical protein
MIPIIIFDTGKQYVIWIDPQNPPDWYLNYLDSRVN